MVLDNDNNKCVGEYTYFGFLFYTRAFYFVYASLAYVPYGSRTMLLREFRQSICFCRLGLNVVPWKHFSLCNCAFLSPRRRSLNKGKCQSFAIVGGGLVSLIEVGFNRDKQFPESKGTRVSHRK